MREQNGSIPSSPSTLQNGPRRSRRWIIASSVIGAGALLAGAIALGHGRDGGRHHGWGGQMSADSFAHHIGHGAKFMLSEVDATAEQKAQVTAILQSAATEVHSLSGQHLAVRKQLHEILSAATIDRTRLEAVRADGLRLADEASKRILQGVADAAEVLTPEQRAALVAHAESHRH